MIQSPVLKKILDADCCSGCGLCASLAGAGVHMSYSAPGYLRPVQTRSISPETDALIDAVCPGMRLELRTQTPDNHLLWGPVVASRTGYAANDALRYTASSGGVISALLLHLLETGAVDYVIQIAAAGEHPARNVTTASADRADVWAAAGSRYAPSAPLEKLGEHLSGPGRFAVVGKPCDIAAVRALALRDPRVDEKIPMLLSFFCAGVPSTRGAEAIIEKLGTTAAETLSFRYRGDGWPGFATVVTKSGERRRMSYAASWGDILSKHLQFRCKICPDGSGGFADVVCGDAWESDDRGYPKFAERDGRSLIVSRTRRGEELVLAATAAGVIHTAPLPVDRIAAMQPSQAKRKRLVLSRLLAMRIVGRTTPRYAGLRLREAALSAGLFDNARSFLGLIRRLVTRTA